MKITFTKSLIWFLLFLFPIFFLPFSFDPIFFPKKTLFFILVTISLISWFFENFLSKKNLILKEAPTFYIFLFLLFLFGTLSTLFSVSKEISFWGFPLEISDGFDFFIFSLVFVLIFLHTFEEKAELKFGFLLLLTSSFLISLFLIFQFWHPRPLFGISFLNPLGGLFASSIFFVILIPIALSFFFQARTSWKIFFGILITSFFYLILALGAKLSLILLSLMLIFLLIFSVEKEKGIVDPWRIRVISGLLALSIFFYFFPLKLPIFPKMPIVEPSISFLGEIPIVKGATSQGIKNIFLGTGPATFILAYSKYRPLVLNETFFWGTRFSSGASLLLDWLITRGILATLCLIFLFIFNLLLIFKKILKETGKFSFFEIGIFASALGLFFASFFYSFNLNIWFLFWLVLGSAIFSLSKQKTLDFSTTPILKAFFFAVFFVVFTILLIVCGFQSQKYVANIYYKKAVLRSQTNLEVAIEAIKKATKYDPKNDLYLRDLSQLLLFKANQLALNENISLDEKKGSVNQLIEEGLKTIEEATSFSPYNVANWNVRGFFYRNLIGIQGAGEMALASYRKAIELEPNSPYPFAEMGRVYILISQDFANKGQEDAKKEAISLAKAKLEEALQKKPDYAPAHYLMAVAFSQEGKEIETISKLEETLSLTPNDLGVAFQLSLLYYRANNLEKAQNLLEKILGNFPNYSNARYLLGLIYDKKGDKEKTIEQFKKVFEINPENEEVKKILDNLEKGLPALEGILFPKTLSEERPDELHP